MKKLLYLAVAATVLAGGAAYGQASDGVLSATDVFRYSQYNYGFGTARSAAMGGAFSSLGADMSSMVLNPAGLGMYLRSELSMSPSVTVNAMKTANHDELSTLNTTGDKTKFAFNNIGYAANLYKGSGALTSFTVGFAYTKLADFGGVTNAAGQSGWSILDAFTAQLNDYNYIHQDQILPGNIADKLDYGENFQQTGAMMAWDSYLINHDPDPNVGYNLNGMLSPDAVLDSKFRRTTNGRVGQYDIAMGFNFTNKLYLGAGFGIQENYYEEENVYDEAANPRGGGYDILNFRYVRNLEQESSAWNFKFGAIVRPIPELRVSAAIHTPTYIRSKDSYWCDMSGYFADNTYSDSKSAMFYDEYDMQTPTRFLAGISGTLGNIAIVSIDYERVWYNKMKLFYESNIEDMDVADQVASTYKPADNIRVGMEFAVSPNTFVRAGYAAYGSMYKDISFTEYGESYNVSGGFGYRTGGWGI
ncbi:MAG: hypothetical protein LBU80_08125, partial [Rikenellaceae bacterium]|nr:hypothetical protein [Rikenellaceae bacterium]